MARNDRKLDRRQGDGHRREIARMALFIETPRLGTADARRISGVLQSLGWRRGSRDSKGNIQWTPNNAGLV